MLYQAVGAEYGLVIWSSDPPRTRQHLYAARRAALDPALAPLQIRLWPNNQLALFHPLENP